MRLQRILAFARHSLAPQVEKYRKPKLPVDDSGAGPPRIGRPPQTLIGLESATPVLRLAAPDHQIVRLPGRLIAPRDMPTARPVTTTSIANSIKQPNLPHSNPLSSHARSPTLVDSAYSTRTALPKYNYLHLIQRPTVDDTKSTSQIKTPGRANIEDALPISRNFGAHRTQESTARQTITSTWSQTALRVAPPLSTGEARSDQTATAQSDAPSSKQKSYLRSEQQHKVNRGSSTAHFDGASLGQWTVQHLERILAKPASGMTGVDPRVNPPRGRVSPF